MTTIFIRKRKNEYGGSDYEVETDGITASCLCWDEMLGAFARICLQNNHIGCAPFSNGSIEYELRIEKISHHEYTIFRDDRFCGYLTFDEALGFLAKFTLMGEGTYRGFETYEQWINTSWRSRTKVPIVGLLPAPEGIA